MRLATLLIRTRHARFRILALLLGVILGVPPLGVRPASAQMFSKPVCTLPSRMSCFKLTKEEEDALDAQCEQRFVVISFDPNDIVGPQGWGEGRHVHPSQAFGYQISFENLVSATAPAHVVEVSATLDTTLFDLATFAFGPIAVGDLLILPPPGVATYATEVDLRPGRPCLLKIRAVLDAATGEVRCTFTSVDTLTGDLPEDAMVGFLPPNTVPPQGQGSASYTVSLRPGLADGTVVNHQATILFDLNAPINTPVWTNTIDSLPPGSRIIGLDPVQSAPQFRVAWSGSDAGSGLRDADVYVSEDGGPFDIWLAHTTAASDTFPGAEGHTYSFFTVARDRAGNVETPPASADDTTRVGTTTAALLSLVASDARPGRVELKWWAPAQGIVVRVWRDEAGTGWEPGGEIVQNASGYLALRDTTVVGGRRYGYRLTWGAAGPLETVEAWVDVPAAPPLRVVALPQARSSSARLLLTLPAAGEGELSAFDVAGRRRAVIDLRNWPAGEHVVDLSAPSKLAAGIYFIRVTHSHRRADARLVVLE